MRVLAMIALLATSSASAGDALLPPAEFDRPYIGSLTIKRGMDERDMLVNCPNVPAFGYPRLGCAYRFLSQCIIFLAEDRIILGFGHDPEIVLRHELGHCNGWSKHHEGAR